MLLNQSIKLQEARYVIESVICDPNFEGLVLGCIEADFRNQILVGKLLTRSIRLTFLCTAPLAKNPQIFVELLAKYANISKSENVVHERNVEFVDLVKSFPTSI